MYLDQHRIDGTTNYDMNPCFTIPENYPISQEKLEDFKSHLIDLVDNKESKTFYKFGDGDYFFLRKESVGSAGVGMTSSPKLVPAAVRESFRAAGPERILSDESETTLSGSDHSEVASC